MSAPGPKPRHYLYEPGAVRWFLVPDKDSDKLHRAPSGWKVTKHELTYNPITFAYITRPQTWIKETYVGQEK
jgi:hypothetical protein